MPSDRIDTMRLLVRIVERGSFSAAARDLDWSRAAASEAIKRLEARLGVRLLDRTTRHVAATLEGEAYCRRVRSIIELIDEVDGHVAPDRPSGRLRIDVHGYWARTYLVPHLPAFLRDYPGIDLCIGENDRFVDLIREGVDCVLRHGEPPDSGLTSRLICRMPEATCASPAYLARQGVPTSLGDLAGHRAVGFLSSRTGEVMPLEFGVSGKDRAVRLRHDVCTSGSETMVALARAGFGLIQAPRFRFADDFASGSLVEVLADFAPSATPVYALYAGGRLIPSRLRAFLDWLRSLDFN